APERMCAPTSEPFSTTTTEISGSICLMRIAAARPAGPAPTITTSNSIASRAGRSAIKSSLIPYCPLLHRGGNRGLPVIRSAMGSGNEKAARALLDFYAEAGVDTLLEERPVDRFASDASPSAAALPVRPQATATSSLDLGARPAVAPALTPPDEAAMAAREAARSAKT